jgi:hypothetical protein
VLPLKLPDSLSDESDPRVADALLLLLPVVLRLEPPALFPEADAVLEVPLAELLLLPAPLLVLPALAVFPAEPVAPLADEPLAERLRLVVEPEDDPVDLPVVLPDFPVEVPLAVRPVLPDIPPLIPPAEEPLFPVLFWPPELLLEEEDPLPLDDPPDDELPIEEPLPDEEPPELPEPLF